MSEIQIHDKVAGELLEQAWSLYEQAFKALNALTVQRHMMTAEEFDQVMIDWRWSKFVAVDDAGVPAGLATYTNHLEAHPLLSEDYFAANHPEEFVAQRIWWVGFAAVAEGVRGTVTFRELVKAMYGTSGDGAITGIDYAKVNVDRGLALAAQRYLHRVAGERGRTATCDLVDYQGFFLYRYPEVQS